MIYFAPKIELLVKRYVGLIRLESSFTFRVVLHYGGEVHRLVKNFSPRHGYLRQGMVCQRIYREKVYQTTSPRGEVHRITSPNGHGQP
jgi:hypothetical protein